MTRAVTDMAAAESVAASYVGERLGLYRALAEKGPVSAAEVLHEAGFDTVRVAVETPFNLVFEAR